MIDIQLLMILYCKLATRISLGEKDLRFYIVCMLRSISVRGKNVSDLLTSWNIVKEALEIMSEIKEEINYF